MMRVKLLSILLGAAIATPICGHAVRSWAAYQPPIRQVESASYPVNHRDVTDEERDLLAQLVEAEAGDQDIYGKQLVVDVVLNRRDRGNEWPDSIHEVIAQNHQFSTWPVRIRAATPTPEDYIAVDLETHGTRSNTEVHYFDVNGYVPGSVPIFKCGDHYFGK